MPTLALYRGNQSIRYIELGQADLTIGRALESGIVLEDSSRNVSRHHADLRHERGQYRVISQSNTNGVWLGSQPIDSYVLRDGDEFQIGPYRLVFLERGIDSEIPDSGPYASQGMTTGPAVPPPQGNAGSPTTKAHIPGQKKPGRLPVPALVLGAVALGVVAIFAIAWLTQRPDLVVDVPPPAPTPIVEVTPPPPPPPSELDTRVTAAQTALDGSDREAARTAIASAELLGVDDPRVKELKDQFDRKFPSPPPAPTPQADRWPRDVVSVPARPNESPADRLARARRLQEQMKTAQDKLSRGDWRGAASDAQAIQENEPTYPGLDTLNGEVGRQREAEERRRLDALRARFEGGKASEAQDTVDGLVRAKGEYEATQELPEAKDALQRLIAKMKTRGDRAVTDGRQAAAANRRDRALAAFEDAVKLLPANDSNRREAEARLQELRPK